MRVLVLGAAGAVCRETTRDLAKFSSFEEIVAADYNLSSLKELIRQIDDPRLKPLQFDANDYEGMKKTFAHFDIVVNGLPFQYDLAVNRACVEVGVNGLDLSSDDPQFDLDAEAMQKDILFVPGSGATPGVTNMMVRKASESLDELHEIDIYFAAFRCLAPAPGLLQTTLWEFNPEEDERLEVYYSDGKWHPAPPLSGGKAVEFHEHIGVQKVYYVPHDEVYTMPHSYPGIRRVTVRGCFPPHVMALMSALSNAGMLTQQKVKVRDLELPSIEIVRALLAENPMTKTNPIWAYGLVVEVEGKQAGKTLTYRYRNHHPPQEEWGHEAAYYKNVGIPLSIGAQLIASGSTTAKGVKPPELAFPTREFFDALAVRGISIEEEVIETGIIQRH